jgi:hypothetical protein
VRHGAVTADIRTLIRTMAEANPDLIKTVAHVAFEVDDLEQALRGQEVIIPPNSPSAGVRVAFIKVAGAPVELLQIDRAIRSDL